MRIRLMALWLFAATATAWAAPLPPPLEITRDHFDIEVAPDGSYVESREEVERVLDARGIDLLHERKLTFTRSFENLQIIAAYTLKADGRRIVVPPSGVLTGFGQSSMPGFQDDMVVSVFFPNLEIGDSVVLVTVRRQLTPWFAGHFDVRFAFTRAYPAHDVRYAVTAPAEMALTIDAQGFEGGAVDSGGGKKRWVWTYHNDAPQTLERDAVSETDFGPYLGLTTFADYADVARAYRERAGAAAAVTPDIQALADQLTQGMSDPRQKAKALYDWVSSHIAYVAIELGAGGFTPHDAKDVLANRYGDCKDHVVMLETLLKAEGIDSSAVLIDAGEASYKLPKAASPHVFDHVITYLPAFELYLDSTAQLAPFGVLPYDDAGKPVLIAETGEVKQTPVVSSAASSVRVTSEVTLGADGNAEGHSTLTAKGAYGVYLRGMMHDIVPGKESDFFRDIFGPGADGALDRGNPQSLSEPYVVGATYTLPNAVTFPGPGALSFTLGFRPFTFTELVAGNLPPTRNSDYICSSLSAAEDVTINFPAGVKLLSIPDAETITADGIRLETDYDRALPRMLHIGVTLKIDHPESSCTPEYYARVHGSLVKMTNALRRQVIYRGPLESEK
jgi:transglutaminase-like putative cysteine protease